MKVVVRGVRSQSGFGVATIGLLRLLNTAGYDVRFIPLTQDKGQDSIGVSTDTLNWLSSISIDENHPFIKDSFFIEVGSLGYGMNCIKPENVSKYVLYTTTETTLLGQQYIAVFNSKYDTIWTASKFNKAGMYASGIEKDIKVLPHLVDTDKFSPTLKPYKIKNKRGFNFIVNIDFSYRKGLHLLLPAWQEAFSKDDDVSLIMKISDGNFKDPKRPIDSLNELFFKMNFNQSDHAPVLVIPTMIDEQYLPNLYTTGDVYIAPTLGEGFGFPIAEAMACGRPPIVSACSAPSEYVNNDIGFPVHMNAERPIQPITDESLLIRDPNYKGRYIYDLDPTSLADQMWKAYDTPEEDLFCMGQRARTAIKNQFSFEVLEETIKTLIQG